MRPLLLLLLLVPLAAMGQKIYKHVDEDGNVTYSDEPIDEQAEEMDLPPISVVETRTLRGARPNDSATIDGGDEAEDGEESEEEVVRYGSLRIVSPEQDATLFVSEGPVRLGVAADRPLGKGHTYRVFLDGRQISQSRNGALLLQDVTRGTHMAFAQILDASGRVVATSDQVTFHVRQPSLLQPGRRGGVGSVPRTPGTR